MRAWGTYDGDRLVGLMATYDFTLSLPGGELPAPGLTFVSAWPPPTGVGACCRG